MTGIENSSQELDYWTDRLCRSIASRYQAGDTSWKSIKGLNLSYVLENTFDINCFYTLSAALILQGEKSVRIGSTDYYYGAGTMVVTSVDVPAQFSLTASKEKPFISMSLKLDPFLLAELMPLAQRDAVSVSPAAGEGDAQSFLVTKSTPSILEAFDQLLRLADNPVAAEALMPGTLRRIHYLVLTHNAAINLRQYSDHRLPSSRIAKAVAWIRTHYSETIRIEKLASLCAMAPSTFHQHFRSITSITPLQYQKRIRLNEARRLMISEGNSASEAAFAVGYESVQQFTREYKRLFGAPPARDAKRSVESAKKAG